MSVGDASSVKVMGVINLTNDSFYSGSVRREKNEILNTAMMMQEQGADFIDIGARSTAPYKTIEIPEEKEARLVSEAVDLLSHSIRVPLSVDTTRSAVARNALNGGASILNDPYGLAHPEGKALAELAAQRDCSIIITAHENSSAPRMIHDPMIRISRALAGSLKLARESGVKSGKMVIDPGIGFFSDARLSNVAWNCTVLANLLKLRKFKLPILVGVSRKKFLGILGGNIPAEDRLPGSLSATTIAVYNGAHIVRTHDVKETIQAVAVASRILESKQKV